MSQSPKSPARKTSQAGPSLSGTNLERAGDYNQRVTLQSIRIGGAKTKPEIAALTGLTVPAITNITKRLLDDGLILEAGKLHGGRGQPAMTLAVNPDGCFSIGLNIDRDHVTILLLDFAGQVRARTTWEVAFAGPDAVVEFFETNWNAFLKTKGVQADRIIGVGVAMPDDMARVDLPHRPDEYGAWNTVNIRELLSRRHDLPVMVENDAAAAALGELHFGHGLNAPSFFYVLVTSGLGGGLVVEGEYFRGAQGRSGELGFLPVASSRIDAASLQEAVSLSALAQFLENNGFSIAAPSDLETLPSKGQEAIEAWIDLAADLLAGPMVAISCLINPQAVYIGGRLPESIVDRLAAALQAKLAAIPGVPALAPVQRAALAADAPAMGAAILPIIERLLPSRAALQKT
ncbi:ROK family transcriptional regulator [Caulobacter hibisci]|uniref:ROK family transcriptional regulator n=1 Tax=Caulobacter hibisci TaxID=2035993 RepID=A0ABS0STP7_9CAUL|nr:ROK family transcriptional regulator [Caulobacter hibisci]MBI1682754.1 ROK family transcriptional regulator [Caulobacter hibisci]